MKTYKLASGGYNLMGYRGKQKRILLGLSTFAYWKHVNPKGKKIPCTKAVSN